MTLPNPAVINNYGGAKENYGLGVVNALTDRDAQLANDAYADIAAMTRTAIRAWARITLASTTGGLTLVSHGANWGSDSTVAPTLARTTTGIFTIAWPANVTDELGVTRALNLRAALRPNINGATLYHAQATLSSVNVMTLYTFLANGTPDDLAGVTVGVFAI